MNDSIARGMAAAAVAALFYGSALFGMSAARADDITVPGYDYSQRAFPCAEDEVLGYAPQFGPDHVGCIHVDAIAGVR
jgi:hypothetical protein